MKNACMFAWQTRRCFKLKLHSVRSFPCVYDQEQGLKERSQRVVLIQWFDPPPEVCSLRYRLFWTRRNLSFPLPSCIHIHKLPSISWNIVTCEKERGGCHDGREEVHRREKGIGWIIFLKDDRSTVMQITQFPSRVSRNCSRSWNAINRDNPLSRGRWVIRFLSPPVGRKKRPRIVRDFYT